jgi:hypothetical protein
MKREIDEFLGYLRHERNASAHTIAGYRRDLGQFTDYLGEKEIPLRQADNIQIRGFMAHLHERRLKKSTLARKLAAVRSFYQYGVKKKWIAENPARVVATPKQERLVPSFLSEEEMASSSESIWKMLISAKGWCGSGGKERRSGWFLSAVSPKSGSRLISRRGRASSVRVSARGRCFSIIKAAGLHPGRSKGSSINIST